MAAILDETVMTRRTASPVPAASVAVLRDAPLGIELLYLRRSHQLRFAPSTWVFPGGRIDPEDGCYTSQALETAKHAAIREAAEESNLALQRDELSELYHWTTPEDAPRRFATHFFVATLLGDDRRVDSVRVDNEEIVDHRWLAPTQALALRAQGKMAMAVPVFVLSDRLTRFASVQEARTHMESWSTEVMAPRSFRLEQGRVALYEGDAGYEQREPEASGKRHRMWMLESGWRYERD